MLALPLRARRLLLPALVFFGAWFGLPTLVLAQAPAPPAAPTTGFKNLQVLPKDTSRETLKLNMRSINKALGVDCSHCHDEHDMALDNDKKKVAREMMEMVKAVNTKFPTTMKRVTCWTCHRGKTEPDKTPGAK